MNYAALEIIENADQVATAGVVTVVGATQKMVQRISKQLCGQLEVEVLANERLLYDQIEQGVLQGNTVLLDEQIENPIFVTQRVHRHDKTIPVVILTRPENCDDLRRSIMFTPMVGNVITPWSLEDVDNLGQMVISSVQRHKQRRHYLDTIASVQPKIGNLSLSQPELGHYLGRLLEQAPVGVVSLDSAGNILGANKQVERILGMTESEILGMTLQEFCDEFSASRLSNLLKRTAVGQKFGMMPEILHCVGNGTYSRYLEATASRIAYHAEQRGYMVILQDVTRRELMEVERKKSEVFMRKLSGALEQAADAVMITDKHRTIEYVNPAFEQLTGYSADEAVGKATYFLRAGVQNDQFHGMIWQQISSGQVYRGVLINKRKDGTVYHEEKTITPLRDSNGAVSHYISTGRDISERIKAEEAVRLHESEAAHVARLSTLGEMASGIAHELNQPLCAIKTYAQTCLRNLQSDNFSSEKISYGLEQVVLQAELAGEIFRRLRNFSRKGEITRKPTQILAVAHEVEKLISSELTQRRVGFEIRSEGSLPIVNADAIQIEQVLLNLIRNSMDAVCEMPDERSNIVLDVAKDSTENLKVSVTDQGCGVSSMALDHLFEPFFTTKENGLGVGLQISQTIIEAHGGKLFLDHCDTFGACFSFILPAVAMDVETAEPTPNKTNGKV